MNEEVGKTDIQFKDDLRKDFLKFEDFLELIEQNNIEKLKQKIESEIKRINASLQD